MKMPKWFEVENHALNSIGKDLLLLTYRVFLRITHYVGKLLDYHLRDVKGVRNMLLVIMQLHM